MNVSTHSEVVVDQGHVITDSSFVEFLGYDAVDELAYVQLGSGTYVYSNVKPGEFEQLLTADSVGHAFHDFARAHGPYTEYYAEGDLFYTYRQDSLDFADEAEGEKDNVFALINGEGKSTLGNADESQSFAELLGLSDLVPTEEEIAEQEARRRREIALAAAAVSVGNAKHAYTEDIVARSKAFEAYLAGE